MARRPPVPPLAATSGPVRLADSDAHGVARHELLSPRWTHLGRGIRAWGGLDPLDPAVRIGAVTLDVPDYAVLGGWASMWWQALLCSTA